MKKALALILSCCLLLAMFAACASPSDEEGASPPPSGEAPTPTDSGEESPPPAVDDDNTPMVYAIDQLEGKFNPFFYQTGYDNEVISMTQIGTMIVDRDGVEIMDGIAGETRRYNGVDYFYNGVADLKVTKNTDTTVYDIKIRDDLVFSDGHPVDIDDLLFYYYVNADKTYEGLATFYSFDIIGMKNYRENNSLAETLTAAQISEAKDNLTDDQKAWLSQWIIDNVIVPVMEEELDWVQSGDADQYLGFLGDDLATTTAGEKLHIFYEYDEDYDPSGKSDEEVLADMIAQYGDDYETLGVNYGGSPGYFAGGVNAALDEKVLGDLLASMSGEPVSHISGIERISDYEVRITTRGYDASAIYGICSATIAPMHYYGDESLWDYEAGSFGFPRGDLSKIRNNNAPMGAGPYKFVKYENKVVYYEANELYHDGVPTTQYLQFKETVSSDKFNSLISGVGDVTNPSFTDTLVRQIKEANSNGDISGDKIETSLVSNLGYGYLALNAYHVNVGGEPGSEASRNLRKALATIYAVCRDVPIDSYYVGTAQIINYPISDTSWAAPRTADPGYELAYSKKVDGSQIYDPSMNMQQRYEAAQAAALEYLEAAGYTVEGGVATAAPAGAKLSYTVVIPGGGEGDHPSFGVLTDAANLFADIGITLNIHDAVDTTNDLFGAFNSEQLEMWCAAWGSTVNVDLFQLYHSENIITGGNASKSNIYHVADSQLDALIMESRTSDDRAFRKAVFKQCFDIVLDWAVEVPVYQRSNVILFASERIDVNTIVPDISPYYEWYQGIDTMAMYAQ